MKYLCVLSFFVSSLVAQATPLHPLQEEPFSGGIVVQRLGDQFQQTRDSVSDHASTLISNAMSLLGVPYKYGGTSAETGFDCSGFVRAVFEQSVGKVLPRRAQEQAAAAQVVERADLKPGDLVFFNTMRRAFSHVGIYLGDGQFIHSPRKGSKVRVEDMRQAYWQKRFNGARRVAIPLSNIDVSRQNGSS